MKLFNKHIGYFASMSAWGAGWYACCIFDNTNGAIKWIAWGVSLIVLLLVVQWIDGRIEAIKHEAYSAGIAAEKAKQNQYVEQMQEPPYDGDLMG